MERAGAKPRHHAREYESTAALMARSTSHRDAAGVRPAAHVCLASICWWSIFNMWGAVRAARLIDATPASVEVAVATNWLLSEFLPSLVIALVLFLQVESP